MPFEKGHKKSKGRPKGTPNKTTKAVREAIAAVVGEETDNVSKALAAIYREDKYKYIQAWCKLAEYVLPKQQEVTTENKTPTKIIFK